MVSTKFCKVQTYCFHLGVCMNIRIYLNKKTLYLNQVSVESVFQSNSRQHLLVGIMLSLQKALYTIKNTQIFKSLEMIT